MLCCPDWHAKALRCYATLSDGHSELLPCYAMQCDADGNSKVLHTLGPSLIVESVGCRSHLLELLAFGIHAVFLAILTFQVYCVCSCRRKHLVWDSQEAPSRADSIQPLAAVAAGAPAARVREESPTLSTIRKSTMMAWKRNK